MAKSNGNRPKIDLQPGEELKLRLLHDQPVTGSNTYGPYYMYAVTNDGTESVFFAPAEVHEVIVEHHLKKGSEFILRRPNQNGSKSKLQIVLIGNEASSPEPGIELAEPASDGYRQVMIQSLQDAIAATKAMNTMQWSVDDVRSIALTIFIQRARG